MTPRAHAIIAAGVAAAPPALAQDLTQPADPGQGLALVEPWTVLSTATAIARFERDAAPGVSVFAEETEAPAWSANAGFNGLPEVIQGGPEGATIEIDRGALTLVINGNEYHFETRAGINLRRAADADPSTHPESVVQSSGLVRLSYSIPLRYELE